MDRKQLSREYKETPRPMGVFRVWNTVNNRWLIGTSTDLPAMLNRQRFQLTAGSHPSRSLQADWRAMGAESFEFEVLDTLKPSEEPGYDPKKDLEALKEIWLEKLRAEGHEGYEQVGPGQAG